MNAKKYFEGNLVAPDSTKLFYRCWPKENAKGTILFTHGQGEHSGCYDRLLTGLSNSPWTFWGWDMRGHGKSDGKRGYAANFTDIVDDFSLIANMVREKTTGPLVLLGHSMGGLVTLSFARNHLEFNFDGMILSSPLMGLCLKVPTLKSYGAKLLNQYLPQLTLGNEISDRDLTRDPNVIAEYQNDPYRHGRISSGVFLGFMDEIEQVKNHAAEITKRCLMQIPESDPVADSVAAADLFENLGSSDKTLKIYADAKHEIYNDLCRDEVFKEIAKFLKAWEK